MGLSRLENFLRSIRGNIIYVDPNALDSTDSIENDGTSAARPFKTLQRALIEAARFSYLPGLDNDKFGNTTILLYPGDHLIDNRPGLIPLSATSFLRRNGTTTADFYELDLNTNFDIESDNNILYKFNSIHGGVILPRGTSIVGMDLRKTKIRPKYVPNPENDSIERSAIFRVTGACYLWQMTIFDADPNGLCFKDYTSNKFVPNFSHHKLTVFEYADGVNPVIINDAFNDYSSDRTDLEMYYEKIGLAYGLSSGRTITPDYPNTIDIQPKIDEYRIVGSRGAEVGISSIIAGNGSGGGDRKIITVFLEEEFPQLNVDTPIRISEVGIGTFNGQYVVKEVVNKTQIKYASSNPPPIGVNYIPGQGTLTIVSDTVTSSSPYIFNCSLRSVYGICGLHADGRLVDGFKSIVVAQFTGISLQKDNNAFVKYDETTGTYVDSTNTTNIYSDSLARYKPEYETYHIKASNDAFIQAVSVFAIGFSKQFEVISGGDISLTNSNSNFGAKALASKGYRDSSFDRDDQGYISHIVPPKEITTSNISLEFGAIDISKTLSISNNTRLYLYNETNINNKPISVIDGYRIGAKVNDELYVNLSISGITSTYSAPIIMQGSTNTSYQKQYDVDKQEDLITNQISDNVIKLTAPHNFINGETVRVISETGEIPDGLDLNKLYYVITNTTATGIGNSEIKLATSLNDAKNGNLSSSAVTIYTPKTTNLKIVSRVSDKSSGDIGHPIQYDSTNSQWYLQVQSNNQIYNIISSYDSSVSPRTYIIRRPDNRNYEDTIYKFRFVIPKESLVKARPPLDGFIIQDTTTNPQDNTEIEYQYSPDNTTKTLDNTSQLKNFRFISGASWSSSIATIQTEIPHYLSVGCKVQINNVLSSNNPTGVSTSGYNGTYTITSIPSKKSFTYSLTTNPGTFLDNTSVRTTSLPSYKRVQYNGTYISYRSNEIQKYIKDKQDGVYYISVVNSSNSPLTAPFDDEKFTQPIQNLYPQLDRDNVISDPVAANSFALPNPIGQVIVNNPENSITKETLDEFLEDNKFGIKVSSIISNSVGTSHTFYTSTDHGFNPITGLSVSNAGSAYGTTGAVETLYNARLVGGSGEGATAVIKINASGSITHIELIDGGSFYQTGDVLSVVGVATTTGHVPGSVTVTSVYNHVNEVIELNGITNKNFIQYNNLYRITGISSSRNIVVSSAGSITSPSTVGFGLSVTYNSQLNLTGKSLSVNGISHNGVTGIATVTFTTTHGLTPLEKVKLTGANNSFFNGDFIVTNINSSTSVNLNVGRSSTNQTTTGTVYLYRFGYTSKDGLNLGVNEERLTSKYAGITDTIAADVTITDTSISITNVNALGLKIGDYIEIDNEIMRIRQTVNGNPISVFRGALGTRSVYHSSGSILRKIKPYPIEFRRHSILRASGHTFEYVGFGPGNYSSAFPDRQDRQISDQEELLSQSYKTEGGVIVYTGMNNDGDFYIGNKRVSSSSGQEEIFDSPIPTIRGEDSSLDKSALNIINSDSISVTRSIKVEGGKDKTTISEFNGPVIFNEKLTSNSNRGIEAISINLQGDAEVSRKYTVGISTPVIGGNSGDIQFISEPVDSVGYVYTKDNQWRKFGPIQDPTNGAYIGIWSGTFYGDGSNLINVDSVWSQKIDGTIYTQNNVGIGTSVVPSDTKFKIKGKTYIDGLLNVTEIIEKATIVSNWPTTATDINIYLGDNNVYYYTANAPRNWTLNFTGYTNGTTLNQLLEVGDSITVAFMAKIGSTAYYNSAIKVDGVAITPKWFGAVAPTSGYTNGIDTYTYVILKTASNTFTILASQSQYA